MEQFLASLPKPVLAIGAIVLGFVLIVLFDPPKTVCDSQIELFRESQKIVLYSTEGADGKAGPAILRELFSQCQGDTGPGACFEYFERLKKIVADLDNVPNQCSETAASEVELQMALFGALKLMSQIAWGDRGPASISSRHSWFDASDVALFCDLKRRASRIYGDETANEWRETILSSLPGAEKLLREQLWQKSMYSTACDSFR